MGGSQNAELSRIEPLTARVAVRSMPHLCTLPRVLRTWLALCRLTSLGVSQGLGSDSREVAVWTSLVVHLQGPSLCPIGGSDRGTRAAPLWAAPRFRLRACAAGRVARRAIRRGRVRQPTVTGVVDGVGQTVPASGPCHPRRGCCKAPTSSVGTHACFAKYGNFVDSSER